MKIIYGILVLALLQVGSYFYFDVNNINEFFTIWFIFSFVILGFNIIGGRSQRTSLMSGASRLIESMGKSVSQKGIFGDAKSKEIIIDFSGYIVLILYAVINLIFMIITL